MEEEIAQLKSVLRSLVVSSPTQVDVRSLLRDYRNMIGSEVPLRKYGYNNPVEFFKERFGDCFLFSGATSNPVLTLIVPETLKHIDKFVQKQKSSTKKFNPKRRSVPEQLVNTNQEKPLSKKNNIHHILSLPIELSKATYKKSSGPEKIRPTQHHIPSSKPNIPPTHTESHGSTNKQSKPPTTCLTSTSKPNTSCRKLDRRIPFKSVNNIYNTFHSKHNGNTSVANGHADLEYGEETDSNTEDAPINSTEAVKKFLKKRLPRYLSEQHLDDESTEECSKTIHDEASGLYTSSSGSSAKALQLERLKKEIMVLITEAEDGVWCTDLLQLYRDRYNRELNFTRLGYTSILSLVYCLEEQVEITRPEETGDWMLRKRGLAPPPSEARPRRRPAPPPPAPPGSLPHHDDDALPGIDFDPDVFPEDCMHFMESIESTSMSDFQPGAMVEVMIGEVYSPSHFWLIRLGENYNIAMEDMMDEMTRYYRGEGRERELARGAVRVGHYCASLYERDWHRSLIVKLIDSDTVKVRHIDYGTVDTLSVGALKPLKRCWAALPAQACRARLGGVRPCAGAPRWPHAAATAFLALVTDRRLVANVVALDAAARQTEVLLIDTASERDVSVGDELLRAGHADARFDSALHTLEVYQLPRFEALESGATPNYAEVHSYLRDGIALDFVPAYRDHVPQPLPPEPYEPPSACASEPPDESRSIGDAPDRSPSPSSETRTSTDITESTANSDLPLRIPLLLPDNVLPSQTDTPQTKTDTAAEPSSPPRSAEPSPLPRSAEPSSPPRSAEPSSPPRSAKPLAERPTLPSEGQWPLPTSYLSPYAPAYVPGASYLPPGSASPAPYGCSLLPQYGGPMMPMRPPGVTLSLEECETYRALSHMNPAAAHWFIVGAMGRATAVPHFIPQPCPRPPPPCAPPNPPPNVYPQQKLQVHPPVRIRPPPGFRSF